MITPHHPDASTASRCTLTGNLCGTDTVQKGQTCPDARNGFRCKADASTASHDLREAVDALIAAARDAEERVRLVCALTRFVTCFEGVTTPLSDEQEQAYEEAANLLDALATPEEANV